MRILPFLLAIMVALSGATPQALAQKADQKSQKKEKVKKKLRAYRAMVLVDELDLDETTATKLMPILDKYDEDFVKLAKQNLELRGKLDTAADSDLDTIIDDLVANQRARWDLDEARFKEVRKVLSAKQAGRILVVLPEIDRKILQGAKAAAKAAKVKGAGKAKGKGNGKARKARPDGDVLDPFAEP